MVMNRSEAHLHWHLFAGHSWGTLSQTWRGNHPGCHRRQKGTWTQNLGETLLKGADLDQMKYTMFFVWPLKRELDNYSVIRYLGPSFLNYRQLGWCCSKVRTACRLTSCHLEFESALLAFPCSRLPQDMPRLGSEPAEIVWTHVELLSIFGCEKNSCCPPLSLRFGRIICHDLLHH